MRPDLVRCIYCGCDVEHSRGYCPSGHGHKFEPTIAREQLADGPILSRNGNYSDEEWIDIQSIALAIFSQRRGRLLDAGLERHDSKHVPAMVKTVAQNALLEAMIFYDAFLVLRDGKP